jgi:hypothetical protein
MSNRTMRLLASQILADATGESSKIKFWGILLAVRRFAFPITHDHDASP